MPCKPELLLLALNGCVVFACSGESSTQRAPSSAQQPSPKQSASGTVAQQRDQPLEVGPRLATLQPLVRRQSDHTVIDRFSAAHTFGGWRTNSDIAVYCAGELPATDSARCHDTDFRTAWITDGKRLASLLLPSEVRGKTVTLSIQGNVTLYADGKDVGKSSSQTWTRTSFEAPAGEGFVKIGMRAVGQSSYGLEEKSKRRSGAAVRWLAYGPDEAREEIGTPSPATYASPTRAFFFPVSIKQKQAPAQLQVHGVKAELQIVWLDASGKRTAVKKRAQHNNKTLYDLSTNMRDGLLEVRGKTEETSALTLTLHAQPAADESPGTDVEASVPPVKNVIVFLVDTLRADKLKIYEKTSRVQTPALDQWAQGATRFTAAHTQENWTKPSVATLLSSTMPWQHKATTGDAVVPKRIATMSELLQKEGFHTGFFSSNGYVSDKFGFGRGWHTYRNYIREGRKNPAQYVARDVMEWLDKRPQDKRFFLYVHTIDPHVPYRPPNEFSRMYDPEPYSGVVNFRKDATLLENIKMGKIKLRARDKEQLVALYDGEITYHDVWFGKILEGLKERGLDQNTAMVFTSDHGEEFWDHGSVGHGHNVYEELLHIPMVMRIPGIKTHRPQIDAPMGLVDVAPTMFEALGLKQPESFVGQSQLAKMANAAPIEQTATVSGFMDNWRTIVMADWKLIMKGNLDPRLYHLPTDPTEQTNVVNEHPMVAWALMQRLGQELGRTAPKSTKRGAKPRVEKTTIDPKTREQLRALGYIE